LQIQNSRKQKLHFGYEQPRCSIFPYYGCELYLNTLDVSVINIPDDFTVNHELLKGNQLHMVAVSYQ